MDAGPSQPRTSPSSDGIESAKLRSSGSSDPFQRDEPPIYDETNDRSGVDDDLLPSNGKVYMDDSHPGTPARMGGSMEETEREAERQATMEQKRAMWWRNTAITAMFIASWYTFATLLSLYNKWMFTAEYYNFPYPLFVTFCHMLVQFTLAAAIRLIWPNKFRPPERPSRQEYASKIAPTALSTVGDIGLSNMSLKVITLSLYTMAKSSSLLFVLLFAFLFRVEIYSHRLLSVILLITFGVFLMVFNNTAVSIPGLIMVFSASALAGLRWALTELVMRKSSMGLGNPFATIFWLAPLMALTIGLVSMGVEGWFTVFGSQHFQGGQALATVGVIIFPGGLAFAMVASEYFIIHRSGSVPLSIAGIFKEVTTITFSAWVFGDQLTELNVVGVVVTISGIATYTYHKYQKSMSSDVPLDSHGKRLDTERDGEAHLYARAPASHEETRLAPALSPNIYTDRDAVPLSSMTGRRETEPETNEERSNRLRDDFEGWDRRDADEWSEEDDEPEAELEEVATRREQRNGVGGTDMDSSKSWGAWWEKSL